MRIQKSKIVADLDGGECVVRFLPTSVREMSDVQKIMDEVTELARNYQFKVMVISFARLKAVTSSFLGRLIALKKQLEPSGVALRLCGMSGEVEQAFKICRLHTILPYYETEEKALKG